MRALGREVDISSGIPVLADLAAGANTGNRFHMRNYENLMFVFHKGLHSAGTDDIILTLQEHNAATAGVSQNLAKIDSYMYKRAATLDGTQQWVEVTQAAAATITLAGATYATLRAIVVFEISAAQLSDGFEWLSVNIADPGAGGTIPATLLYVASELKIQRDPTLLAQPNA